MWSIFHIWWPYLLFLFSVELALNEAYCKLAPALHGQISLSGPILRVYFMANPSNKVPGHFLALFKVTNMWRWSFCLRFSLTGTLSILVPNFGYKIRSWRCWKHGLGSPDCEIGLQKFPKWGLGVLEFEISMFQVQNEITEIPKQG